MKKFIVTYTDIFENYLQMTEFMSDSKIDSLYDGVEFFTRKIVDYYTLDEETFKEDCFEHDFLIEAYEIQ